MENAFCGGCYWWDESICRLRAPVAGQGWPKTEENDWCGSFQDIGACESAASGGGVDPTLRAALDDATEDGMQRKNVITRMQDIEPGLKPLAARMRITRAIKAGLLELREGGAVAFAPAKDSGPTKIEQWGRFRTFILENLHAGPCSRSRICTLIKGIAELTMSEGSALVDAWAEAGFIALTDGGLFKEGSNHYIPEIKAQGSHPKGIETKNQRPAHSPDDIRRNIGDRIRQESAFFHGSITPVALRRTLQMDGQSDERFAQTVDRWIALGLVIRLPDGSIDAGPQLGEVERADPADIPPPAPSTIRAAPPLFDPNAGWPVKSSNAEPEPVAESSEPAAVESIEFDAP